MEISKFLLQTTALSLDALFKASDADIRIHNIENLPGDNPVLFVVNHFTRLETTFMPYIIYRNTGKYALSLAHHSFFKGTFGKILEKVGAISTKHPKRDTIFINNLLTGNHYTLIFPEGQMIKDKKIIEKGKLMVYNMGIRRPPHTGAARIALRAQFYREKIKYFHEMGYEDELKKYMEVLEIKDEDLDKILNNETYIVPVNITYYPIRAKNNSIKRMVERFTKNMPDRMGEELEVEGTMIMEGVDIDINFGKPIPVKNYLYKDKNAKKQINNTELFLEENDMKKHLTFRNVSINLMNEYMTSIYTMTTVNHEHIFAYILSMYPKKTINETDFKNRANLAIERIKELDLTNFHTTLKKKQQSLETDDFNYKYNMFIEAAISDNLINIKHGCIIKNWAKFSLPYQFHAVRKNNIAEVLKNEIEPLKDVIRTLRKVMFTSQFWVNRRVRRRFLKIDQELFQKDYREFFIPGETKPASIGMPFFKKKPFSKKGIILIHGYMAAPEEIRPLADYLYDKGYAVYGARLRGHGTSPEDLSIRNWEEWYDSVNRAYVVMKNSVREFAVLGFSTGAGLALLQAANKGKKLKGIISINAPLRLQNIASRLSSAIVLWNKFLKKIDFEKPMMEFVQNRPENPHINYFRNPISGVNQLGELMNNVEKRLNEITIPTLIIQGSNDPVVNPESGREIFEKLETMSKEFFEVESNRHGILRGDESLIVFDRVEKFLKEIFN